MTAPRNPATPPEVRAALRRLRPLAQHWATPTKHARDLRLVLDYYAPLAPRGYRQTEES